MLRRFCEEQEQANEKSKEGNKKSSNGKKTLK
jgi:hypothetical protein